MDTPSNNSRPPILVTNDDGIDSAGLWALASALNEIGAVTVVAPDRNWSISGHQKSLKHFLRADPYVGPVAAIPALATSGSPADCVAMAMMGLVEPRPALVVSGINRGPNLGQDITYSGTVAAAFESTLFGCPAIAISLNSRDPHADFGAAAQVAARVAQRVLAEGLPRHTLLNINAPALPPSEWRGLAITRLGLRDFHDELLKRVDPSGRPYYWITGNEPGGDVETADTDIWAVHHAFVSVTPVRLDMTDERMVGLLAGWGLGETG